MMAGGLKIDMNKRPLAPAAAFDLLLGGGNSTDKVVMISINKLDAYDNHPFKPYPYDKLRELAEDIAMNGVLSPILVRPNDNGYQILAGHNRTNAAKLAGLTEIPGIIKENCGDDLADLIVVNTNLNQRDELLPSEKAFAYKMQLDAIRKIGATSCRTSAELQDRTGENKRNIQRYLRLTHLIPDILDMVDNDSVSFIAGVNLSFLSPDAQLLLATFICERGIATISLKQSEKIKAAPELTESSLLEIFGLAQSPKSATGRLGAASKKVLEQHFKGSRYTDNEIAEILSEVLKRYFAELN